jgi:hypothetical protein
MKDAHLPIDRGMGVFFVGGIVMGRATIDRPGLIIFIAGVACVFASTVLGFYLAYEAQAAISRPDFNQYLSHDARWTAFGFEPMKQSS